MADLKPAVDGVKRSPFHMGENDKGPGAAHEWQRFNAVRPLALPAVRKAPTEPMRASRLGRHGEELLGHRARSFCDECAPLLAVQGSLDFGQEARP